VSVTEVLRRVIPALDAAEIPYMISGSIAATIHGVQRSTYDVDIVIDPSKESLERFVASLDPNVFYGDMDAARDAFRRRSQFNLIDMATNWKVDLIIRKHRPFSVEELRRRARATYHDVELHVATPEDSILSKLEWAKAGESERQLRDVREIVKLQGDRLDRVYVEHWVRELGLEELWQRVKS
jgi:hypothetical protein